MFIPTTREELKKLKWHRLDVILVTGDAYIDSPFVGVALIGKILINAGFKVGIIAQPRLDTIDDITRLGNPKLFWGVSAGCMDSMVANYTATKKFRKSDDLTPGGENTLRPDRATIQYTNLIKKSFKETAPIMLGGIEASLRRMVHYDFWTNKLRRSVLFDSKADFLLHSMSEKSIVELAKSLQNNENPQDIRGLCYIDKEKPENALELPSYEECVQDSEKFIKSFEIFYKNCDPKTAKKLIQKNGDRYLVQNPPQHHLNQEELNKVYELEFENAAHPFYAELGKIKALETIQFSVPTHFGCYGECNFCAISVHQGKTVRSRSISSILNSIEKLSQHPNFKGTIADLGGPTANMFGFECEKKLQHGECQNRRCLFPEICPNLKIQHQEQITLLEEIRKIPKVKNAFIASGIRYDLILADKNSGEKYLETILENHISGQMKVAPEHVSTDILKAMGKCDSNQLLQFKKLFDKINSKSAKKKFLTYYLMAAYPSCQIKEMLELKKFTRTELKTNPEQVQIFTPTPSTWASVMYYTEMNPFTKEKIFVEKDIQRKQQQKDILF